LSHHGRLETELPSCGQTGERTPSVCIFVYYVINHITFSDFNCCLNLRFKLKFQIRA